MEYNIEIYDDYYSVNGSDFSCAPCISDIQKIFGNSRLTKPKVEAAKSDIYTFDDSGIWVYVENEIVNQISLLFSEPYLYFHPKNKSQGMLKIKGKELTNSDEFTSIDFDEIYLDEWEAEGSISMALNLVCINITADYETKDFEDVSFWFGPKGHNKANQHGSK